MCGSSSTHCHQMLYNRVQDHKRSLERLRQQVDRKKKENRELDQQLVEMQVSVVERQGVENLAGQQEWVSGLVEHLLKVCISWSCSKMSTTTITGVPSSEANAKQRMQGIVKRRRLVELVRAQAGEISVLTTEVEKLRMRTFPALVQVD